MINGTDFRLTVGDNTLLGETSTGISWSGNTIEVTTKPTDGYAEFIPGHKSASIQFDKLLSFDENLEVGSIHNFHLGRRSDGYSGKLIIESIDINASSDELISYSGSGTVVGELLGFIPDIQTQNLQTRAGVDILTRSGDQIQVRTQVN